MLPLFLATGLEPVAQLIADKLPSLAVAAVSRTVFNDFIRALKAHLPLSYAWRIGARSVATLAGHVTESARAHSYYSS